MNYRNTFFIFLFSLLLLSCETVIHPTLESADPVLVVDAWLNSSPEIQTIKVTETLPYFDNQTPTGTLGATVSIKNETDGRIFTFNQVGNEGTYNWSPSSASDSIGKPGDSFTLSVNVGTEQYTSSTTLGRVPAIDSLSFTYQEKSGIVDGYYYAQFWARDPAGKGDTYWIKAWKNDTLLLKPSEINISYDASFSEGGDFDGAIFIQPIRSAITPFDFDKNNKLIQPYKEGDSVRVEIHSISKQAFNFLSQVIIQTDRPGGFGELFASPFANISTNIFNVDPKGKKAVGFFNVASIRKNGKKFVK